MKLVYLIAVLIAIILSVSATSKGSLNPFSVYSRDAHISIRLGHEISVISVSDGKYFYARGCCYGNDYDLQVWGTGQEGTILGHHYGYINGPPFGLDNGNESVLLYIPFLNQLIYWKWNTNVFYAAEGKINLNDIHYINWNQYNFATLGLDITDMTRIAGGYDSIHISNYDNQKIYKITFDNGSLNWRLSPDVVTLSSKEFQIKPAANENGHAFAFDGKYYYFGSAHSGNMYGIYKSDGSLVSSQWGKCGGSILSYDYELDMYLSCGTDVASPPATHVVNEKHGNGAHCSYWLSTNPDGKTKTEDFFNNGEAQREHHNECELDQSLSGIWNDDGHQQWNLFQKKCSLVFTHDDRVGKGTIIPHPDGFTEIQVKFASLDGNHDAFTLFGRLENNSIRFPEVTFFRSKSNPSLDNLRRQINSYHQE